MFGVLSFYVIPLILGISPVVEKSIYRNNIQPLGNNTICYELVYGNTIGQSFDIKNKTQLTKVSFRPITWGYNYDSNESMYIKILDWNNNEVYTDKIKLYELKDYEIHNYIFQNLTLQSGKYILLFDLCEPLENDRKIAITYLDSGEINGNGNAYIAEKYILDQDMQLEILGK